MVENNIRSRSKRHRKKYKNNRNLMMFLALAFLFFTILLSLIVLNKNVEPETEQNDITTEDTEKSDSIKKVEEDESDTTSNENDKEETDEEKNANEEDAEQDQEEDSSTSMTELSPEEIDDSNVLKAYVGDWSPTETSQEGTHTTSYQNGSQDRIEIKRAVSNVTELAEDNLVEWRVENGGDQKVIATVSDSNETEFYRVHLAWVDNQGWQVNRLEELKQNDKK